MKLTTTLILLLFAFNFTQLVAQNPYFPKVLSMEKRAKVIDGWLEERVKNELPSIMMTGSSGNSSSTNQSLFYIEIPLTLPKFY